MDSKLFRGRAAFVHHHPRMPGPVPHVDLSSRWMLLSLCRWQTGHCSVTLTNPRGDERQWGDSIFLRLRVLTHSGNLSREDPCGQAKEFTCYTSRTGVHCAVPWAAVKQPCGYSATPLALLLTDVCFVFLCDMFAFHSQCVPNTEFSIHSWVCYWSNVIPSFSDFQTVLCRELNGAQEGSNSMQIPENCSPRPRVTGFCHLDNPSRHSTFQ